MPPWWRWSLSLHPTTWSPTLSSSSWSRPTNRSTSRATSRPWWRSSTTTRCCRRPARAVSPTRRRRTARSAGTTGRRAKAHDVRHVGRRRRRRRHAPSRRVRRRRGCRQGYRSRLRVAHERRQHGVEVGVGPQGEERGHHGRARRPAGAEGLAVQALRYPHHAHTVERARQPPGDREGVVGRGVVGDGEAPGPGEVLDEVAVEAPDGGVERGGLVDGDDDDLDGHSSTLRPRRLTSSTFVLDARARRSRPQRGGQAWSWGHPRRQRLHERCATPGRFLGASRAGTGDLEDLILSAMVPSVAPRPT